MIEIMQATLQGKKKGKGNPPAPAAAPAGPAPEGPAPPTAAEIRTTASAISFGSKMKNKSKILDDYDDVLQIMTMFPKLREIPYDYSEDQLRTFFGSLRLSILEIYFMECFVRWSNHNDTEPMDRYRQTPKYDWSRNRFNGNGGGGGATFWESFNDDRQYNNKIWLQLSELVLKTCIGLHDYLVFTTVSLQDVYKMIYKFFQADEDSMRPLRFNNPYFGSFTNRIFSGNAGAHTPNKKLFILGGGPINEFAAVMLENMNSAYALCINYNGDRTLNLAIHGETTSRMRFSARRTNHLASNRDFESKRKRFLRRHYSDLKRTKRKRKNKKTDVEKLINEYFNNTYKMDTYFQITFNVTCDHNGVPRGNIKYRKDLFNLTKKRAIYLTKLRFGISVDKIHDGFHDESYDAGTHNRYEQYLLMKAEEGTSGMSQTLRDLKDELDNNAKKKKEYEEMEELHKFYKIIDDFDKEHFVRTVNIIRTQADELQVACFNEINREVQVRAV
jgi:hypothetical protein